MIEDTLFVFKIELVSEMLVVVHSISDVTDHANSLMYVWIEMSRFFISPLLCRNSLQNNIQSLSVHFNIDISLRDIL